MLKFGIFAFILMSVYWLTKYLDRNIKLIELFVLVDNDGRICYTGSYSDLKSKQSHELKLIKLEGVL